MSKLLAASLALLLAVVTPAYAQSSDEAAVARAIDALSAAIVAADKVALEKITWPELSYGHSAGRVENQKQFVDALVSKQTVITSIDNAKMSTTVVGDIAISRGTMTYMVAGAGAPTKTDLTLLLIWQKRGGEWKLLARQAFKV
jgi:type II secretory pathway pseudopilin PulG